LDLLSFGHGVDKLSVSPVRQHVQTKPNCI